MRWQTAAIVSGLLASNAYTASFTPLGDLPGGPYRSSAFDVSADGSVVVGYSYSTIGTVGREAFRWTRDTGMVSLGDIPGGEVNSVARSISDDGSVIVGWGQENFSTVEAVRWTSDGTLERLGDLPGGEFVSSASGVSADGSVVVGQGTTTRFILSEPIRWTPATGIQALRPVPILPGGAFAVSDDGTVIAGGADFQRNGLVRAFLHSAGSFRILEDFPGGGMPSLASGISGDGSVVVGRGYSTVGLEAFRWNAAEGTIGLGDLPGGGYESVAWDVSNDGETIVGRGQTAAGQEAFVWTRRHGMRRLADVLLAKGIELPGWVLNNVYGVSGDGLWVVGDGINPDGFLEGFIANLVTDIAIDIRPGSKDNPIDPAADGVVNVAILSTRTDSGESADFDATQVDLDSVIFGPNRAAPLAGRGGVRDIDRDGDADVVVFFRIKDVGIHCGQTEAELKGTTYDGEPIAGKDVITTVGCE